MDAMRRATSDEARRQSEAAARQRAQASFADMGLGGGRPPQATGASQSYPPPYLVRFRPHHCAALSSCPLRVDTSASLRAPPLSGCNRAPPPSAVVKFGLLAALTFSLLMAFAAAETWSSTDATRFLDVLAARFKPGPWWAQSCALFYDVIVQCDDVCLKSHAHDFWQKLTIAHVQAFPPDL